MLAAHRAVELSVSEAEDPAVRGNEPISLAIWR